jgi:hypothetical protein
MSLQTLSLYLELQEAVDFESSLEEIEGELCLRHPLERSHSKD